MTPPLATAKLAGTAVTEVEAVQARRDTRELPINRVGVKDISHPVRVKDRSAGEQHTIATFNMYVSLPHNFKGTHMSRFVEALHAEREISVETFRAMLAGMTARLEAEVGHIEMSFPFFVMKKPPVSALQSLMTYPPTLAGDEPVPLLEAHLRLRRPQPALARHHHRAAAQPHVDRGAHRDRRERSLVRALRDPEAPRREVRDRARLRQSQVRRGHGAGRGG